MDLEERDINAGNWVDSAQDRDYWRALVKETEDGTNILLHYIKGSHCILHAHTIRIT